MRILVAEDEKELASIITRRLEDEDYAVDTVHNGLDAVSYLQETDYDAVGFMDWTSVLMIIL